jgi:hypothetical protein
MGIDETIERRRGNQISAKGNYLNPVRSSHTSFVKASGLRWVSLMTLVRILWATRVRVLPFLTMLAPSERDYPARSHRPQALLDRAHHAVRPVRRWLLAAALTHRAAVICRWGQPLCRRCQAGHRRPACRWSGVGFMPSSVVDAQWLVRGFMLCSVGTGRERQWD